MRHSRQTGRSLARGGPSRCRAGHWSCAPGFGGEGRPHHPDQEEGNEQAHRSDEDGDGVVDLSDQDRWLARDRRRGGDRGSRGRFDDRCWRCGGSDRWLCGLVGLRRRRLGGLRLSRSRRCRWRDVTSTGPGGQHLVDAHAGLISARAAAERCTMASGIPRASAAAALNSLIGVLVVIVFGPVDQNLLGGPPCHS